MDKPNYLHITAAIYGLTFMAGYLFHALVYPLVSAWSELDSLLAAERERRAKIAEGFSQVKDLIAECLDSQPDTADPTAYNRLLVHYLQRIEQVANQRGDESH